MLGKGGGEEALIFIKVNNVPGTLHFIHAKQESCEVEKKNPKFPSGPMVRTLCFHCRGHTFDPSLGNQDPICRVEGPKIKLKKRKKRGRAGLFKI